MSTELNSDSYNLTLEKFLAATLCAVSLWFSFGEVAQGYGFLHEIFGPLKLAVFVACVFLAFRILIKGMLGAAAVLLILGVIYNPFFRISLGFWVDFASSLSFAWVLWQILKISKVMTPEKIESLRLAEARSNLAEARSEAIAEAVERGDISEEQLHAVQQMISARRSETGIKTNSEQGTTPDP